MSAIGKKQTWAVALQMSAFGGKADMAFCGANSAFDPKRTLTDLRNVGLRSTPGTCGVTVGASVRGGTGESASWALDA